MARRAAVRAGARRFRKVSGTGRHRGDRVQAFINISVVLDMGPTKGFPLPMISLGGSSLLSTLTCLGMLLSVSEHEG